MERKVYSAPDEVTDLAGVRLVTYYNDDAVRLADIVRSEFAIDEAVSVDKASELEVGEFGYRSIHLVVALSDPRKALAEWRAFASMRAEIQIRSVLQHAWAAISHKLDYKAAIEAPLAMRRPLFQLSALLELADEQFAALRDRSAMIAEHYKADVAKGDLDLPLDVSSLDAFFQELGDLASWEQMGIGIGMRPNKAELEVSRNDALARLLQILQAAKVKTVGELKSLLEAARAGARQDLEVFHRHAQTHGGKFMATPLDIVAIILLLALRNQLPDLPQFSPNFREPFMTALKVIYKNRSKI